MEKSEKTLLEQHFKDGKVIAVLHSTLAKIVKRFGDDSYFGEKTRAEYESAMKDIYNIQHEDNKKD